MSTSETTTGAADPGQAAPALLTWLQDELDDAEITLSDNFLDVGGHSLTFLRLSRYLGERFGLELDQTTTYQNDLASALAAARTSVPA